MHNNCLNKKKVEILNKQVIELNKRINNLEKDKRLNNAHVDKLERDNQILCQELKRQQRSNRHIKRQLDDEYAFFQKAKEQYANIIENSGLKTSGKISRLNFHRSHELEKDNVDLHDEIKKLRCELNNKNATINILAKKYSRSKVKNNVLTDKIDKLWNDHLHVMAEMMEKLDEAREELNTIVSDKFQDPSSFNKSKYLQIVQRNSKLMYENASLKIQVQQLIQNIEKLKSNDEQLEPINNDKTIENLNHQAKNDHESSGKFNSTTSCPGHCHETSIIKKLSLPFKKLSKPFGAVKINSPTSQSAPSIVQESLTNHTFQSDLLKSSSPSESPTGTSEYSFKSSTTN
ncbi:hypothetical protein HCN44_010590 [Aphidius gifuensis]|uniref:Uncharacterized protein n=1 Tax=Aphidius gifuensis TaxID=684658 RepID=A0A835CQH4_APHGI|nr:uncharacterized protein LOC122855702 [Aphidius gifuensis]KAF7991789.1 hypothetical protein HCN44_010590 [Aphidius gifuensis]